MHGLPTSTLLMAGILLSASSPALAQLPDTVERSSSPLGFQFRSSSSGPAVATGGNAAAPAGDKSAPAGAGAGAQAGGAAATRATVQIQGNTQINATATTVNAASVGQGNKAANELGAIK
jgi:hypothetical protein